MHNRCDITVICDNNAADNFCSEHGLSLHIATDDVCLLFDTGNGDTIKSNIEASDLDLAHCDYLVLSHGHYDHSGGVDYFLACNNTAGIILHPKSYLERYSKHPGKPLRSIGMPPNISQLLQTQQSERIIHNQGYYPLPGDIICSGYIPRVTDYEDVGGQFFLSRQPEQQTLEQQPDDEVVDDQALYLVTDNGLVIVLGCCHSGLENTILHKPPCYQHLPVVGVIGGLHLSNATDDRIQATLAFLRKQKLAFIYPGHCTGEAAVEKMLTALPQTKVQPLYAGMRISLSEELLTE